MQYPHHIKGSVKKIITGITVPQQYVCLPWEYFRQPLTIKLVWQNANFELDVTHSHLFLGYKPVIIGIVFPLDNFFTIPDAEKLTLAFHYAASGKLNKNNFLAYLLLNRLHKKIYGDRMIVLYQALHGSHFFINPIHQMVNRFRESFRQSHPNNVDLNGNLRDQVRIAYSVPRVISLMTVSNGERINIFPTDLHGEINDSFYVSSLRLGGKANAQVEHSRRVVLSEMDIMHFKNVFALGKNHMKDARPIEEFKIVPERSINFHSPLPEGLLRYRELSLLDSYTVGIHRIHFYETMFQMEVNKGMKLAHIDQYYAQWRVNHGLADSNFLMR